MAWNGSTSLLIDKRVKSQIPVQLHPAAEMPEC